MRDNHPRMRQQRRLERKKGNRPPYPRILIVCEGSETEPNYFNEIRRFKRLSSIYCKIVPSDFGTTPEKIVAYARFLVKEDNSWDEVYCVFDRDEHDYFPDAMQRISDLGRASKEKEGARYTQYCAIPTIPCFELWYVLHFELLSRESERDEVKSILKKHIPEYEKSMSNLFLRLADYLDTAYKNADTLRVRVRQTANENPYTDVDVLVKRLLEIKG